MAYSFSLTALSLFSPVFWPVFTLNILVIAVIFSALWDEIGWAGYAAPLMLKRFRPLDAAVYLGVIHIFWHLAADYWGAAAFYGTIYRYAAHFLLWFVGLVILRILIFWIYVRTQSLVLGWIMHFSYTGGQLLLVPLAFTALETITWNAVFVLVLLLFMLVLYGTNADFRDFWKSEKIALQGWPRQRLDAGGSQAI